MKRYGWIGVFLFLVAVILIAGPSLLAEPHLANSSSHEIIHPHRVANVSVDDAIEQGPTSDTCTLTATNDSDLAVSGFHLTKLNFGQPDKPGGKTPAIAFPKQSFDLSPGQTATIKVSLPKLTLDAKHKGWIEYEYSYTDGNGQTQTAGLGHVPGWKLTQ